MKRRSKATLAELYTAFLKAKVSVSKTLGFEIDDSEIHQILKPHQRVSVKWAVRGGRRAIFASFGLGKTIMQLEILRLILKRAGGRALIVAPLGVRQEFLRDASLLGLELKFVRRIEECGETGLYLTNFETVRDGKLDPGEFTAASIDEAAILAGMGAVKTFREFLRLFQTVKYRFVATATPDPNEYIELLAYAEFLGVMEIGEGKTRFFKRDSTKADHLTLHPHKEEEFWLWVGSWALFVQRPSDLGFSDAGYDLPPMRVVYHEIESAADVQVVTERDGQMRIAGCRDAALGVTEASREKRAGLPARIERVVEIVRKQRGCSGQKSPLLPGEPRAGEGAQVGALSPDQALDNGGGESQKESIHDRVHEDPQEGCNAGTEGSMESDGEGPLCERPGVSGESQGPSSGVMVPAAGTETETASIGAVRTDGGAILHDAGTAGRRVCDLQESQQLGQVEQASTLCRSRSSDGESARDSLQSVQLCNRPTSGRSCSTVESGGISEQFIVWCDLNDEQRAIEEALDVEGISYVSLEGSQGIEERDAALAAWKRGEYVGFVSKPVMYGAGVNLQQCHVAIFAGITYKFRDFIQAISRIVRFLQEHEVEIHIIFTKGERKVLEKLLAKWEAYKVQVAKMVEIIKQYGLSDLALAQAMTRSLGVERVAVEGDTFTLVNNDTVLELPRLKAGSVGLVLTSIPFSTQYEYTPSFNDFGHSEDNGQFFKQMDFLTPELLRVLTPGRVAAVHVKDRVVPGGINGMGVQSVYPFHAEVISHFVKHGFLFMGMKTIVTDVVRENNQTYRLGWTEQCKDGTKMGYGIPEYLLLFRKPQTDKTKGYGDVPVRKDKKRYSKARWQVDAHGFARSNGNRPLTPQELLDLPLAKDFHQKVFGMFHDFYQTHVYDFENHVKMGETLELRGVLPVTFMLLQPPSWHPDVWTDITRMLTLNGAQAAKGRIKHLCPMQLDIADRVIVQMSNEGDLVLDPFSGIGTVPARAVALKRRAYGVELNNAYFLDSVGYCRDAELNLGAPMLFDCLEEAE